MMLISDWSMLRILSSDWLQVGRLLAALFLGMFSLEAAGIIQAGRMYC